MGIIAKVGLLRTTPSPNQSLNRKVASPKAAFSIQREFSIRRYVISRDTYQYYLHSVATKVVLPCFGGKERISSIASPRQGLDCATVAGTTSSPAGQSQSGSAVVRLGPIPNFQLPPP